VAKKLVVALLAKRGVVLAVSAVAALASAKATGHCQGLGFFDH
jgi:hypothetical protein